MEFGQIYGSWARDFVPVEIGAILYSPSKPKRKDQVVFKGRKFKFDEYLVLRKNIIDDLGNRQGVRETVLKTAGNTQIEYDDDHNIRSRERKRIRRKAKSVFAGLKHFMLRLIRGGATDFIFFGGIEDLRLIKRAGVRLDPQSVIDLQTDLQKKFDYVFSLDKAELLIDFEADRKTIASAHYSYPIPGKFKYLIRPHKALGDAARILLLYLEMEHHPDFIDKRGRELLAKIEERKNDDG